MNRAAAIGGLVVLAAGAGAAWYGFDHLSGRDAAPAQERVTRAVPAAARPVPSAAAAHSSEVVDTDSGTPVDAGTTPMAQRVAVIGLLNKRNGVSRDLTLKPGQAVRVGDVIVRLSACEQTAPWEQQALTGAFVQLDVQNIDRRWQRVFSGWLYKERPQLNVVLHPVYDVWTKSCAMSFPGTTPAAAPSPAASAKRSSAPKSPSRAAAEADDSSEPPSAVASNAI
ncbi:hypothetical protein SAMN05216382_2028 [Sphingomonas palmae]|uniref:DUF2155 domain-containing protein n=1 Tax=Sphingomonas palmae TaxID=1855283 RepID=A0A1H7Q6B4_9SPHN|nr:hypothetical protein SAMN05216382_2028 [Sphingomonas palmae]